MLPEDDRTKEEILSRGPTRPKTPGEDWIDHHPEPRKQTVAYMPATMSFVAALLAFCTLEVYSVLVGSWRWSAAGIIVLFVGLLVGSCFQSYANRRAR